MNKKNESITYIIAVVGLILVGIFSTTIINGVRSNGTQSQDIRARATVGNDLKLEGTVAQADQKARTIVIDNVEFAPESRSGAAKNYGSWTITAPPEFALGTATPGKRVSFTIATTSFNVASRQAQAIKMEIK